VLAALALILASTVNATSSAAPLEYEIIWFHTSVVELGLFWLIFSLLVGVLRDLRSSDVGVFHPDTWRVAIRDQVPLSRVVRYLGIALVLPPFITAFAGLKQTIPYWHSFNWDPALHRVDLFLHGGTLPSELLGELAVNQYFTVFLDQVYQLWFTVLILTVTAFAWARSSVVRNQFLLSFFLSWTVMGVLLATVFSSAGPCFWRHVVPGPDPYAHLLAYLEGVALDHDLSALRAQEYLWLGYSTGRFPTEGISAMPSMHVAMATLFSIAGFRLNKLLGLAFLAFLALILLGSFHLAWHYASDGYASIVLVGVIWKLSGTIVRRAEAFQTSHAGVAR
jgi:hypothetical protein